MRPGELRADLREEGAECIDAAMDALKPFFDALEPEVERGDAAAALALGYVAASVMALTDLREEIRTGE